MNRTHGYVLAALAAALLSAPLSFTELAGTESEPDRGKVWFFKIKAE